MDSTWEWACDICFPKMTESDACTSMQSARSGTAMGNVLRGLPIDASTTYTGGFFNLLNPYALLTGVVGVVLLAMHGALFMACKTDGDLQQRMRHRAVRCWGTFLVLFLAWVIYTAFDSPHLFKTAAGRPGLVVLFMAITLAGLSYVPLAAKQGRQFPALLASSAVILGGFGLVGVSIFPTFISAADTSIRRTSTKSPRRS